MSFRDQIRKGSSETLILILLSSEPMYGYQISQEIEKRSDGYFEMKEGLLYPTLHRMKKEGLLSSEWGKSESGRRRKYYTITDAGRQMLGEQTSEWQLFIEQLQALMDSSPQTAEGDA